VQRAKDLYHCNIASQVSWKDIVKDSRKTWQTVRRIEKGSFAHHQPVTQNDMVLTDPDTGQAVSDPESIVRIVSGYTTKLYNRDDAPTDPTVLDDIHQRQYDWTLNVDPTAHELMLGAKGLANNKSPGQSGIPAEALKAFTKQQWETVLPMFVRFWHNDIPHDNYDEWKVAILKLLYKNKGDSKDLKNYRGIVLQDIFARLMSAIIAKRLSKLLAQFGIEEQFGSQAGRGTADANWVLRHLLQTRKAHGIDSHVLFVDLIKAFDTANHDLLFALLGKYGAPPLLVDAVHCLHKDFHMEFKIAKDNQCQIPYTVGVRQGDNMAPVLFLFLLQAFAESTKEAWDREIEPIPTLVCPEPDEILHRGELVNPKWPCTTKGRIVVIGFTIFVDDTAFVFNSRAALERALPFLQRQFARFGLLMHVGTVNPLAKPTSSKRLLPSKTECLWIPARPLKLSCSEKEGKTKDELQALQKVLTQAIVPDRIFWGDSSEFHVHYTDCFKYLGSRIVSTLSDEPEIRHRIRQATAQLHSLTRYWQSKADLKSK